MNLQKQEKKFWQRYFRIEKLDAIPKEWKIIGGVSFGDEQFDDYFYYISLRVDMVHEISSWYHPSGTRPCAACKTAASSGLLFGSFQLRHQQLKLRIVNDTVAVYSIILVE